MQYGIFAVLFVSLFYYQLKESRRLLDKAETREDKLTGFLTDITKQFEKLANQYDGICEDLSEMKQELKEHIRNH
jgi:F0F1-type ATP synthase membrane subunit b/b'